MARLGVTGKGLWGSPGLGGGSGGSREGGEQKEPSTVMGKAPLDRSAMGKLMGQRSLLKGLVDGGKGEKREC